MHLMNRFSNIYRSDEIFCTWICVKIICIIFKVPYQRLLPLECRLLIIKLILLKYIVKNFLVTVIDQVNIKKK